MESEQLSAHSAPHPVLDPVTCTISESRLIAADPFSTGPLFSHCSVPHFFARLNAPLISPSKRVPVCHLVIWWYFPWDSEGDMVLAAYLCWPVLVFRTLPHAFCTHRSHGRLQEACFRDRNWSWNRMRLAHAQWGITATQVPLF